MQKTFFIILLLFFLSCKKDNNITHNSLYYQKAKICRDSNVQDSAFYYYNLAKNDFLRISDSLGVGNCLVNMGYIQTNKGDFFGGIESASEANKFLTKSNDSAYRRALSTNYNNIGLSFHFLKEFRKSSYYYIKTLQYIDSPEDKYLCYNNIGDLLISQKKFDSAKYYLEKATPTKTEKTFSKVINNLAKAQYQLNKNYDPLPQFYKALEIRQKINDGEGLNSSFETLSTYYYDKDKKLSLEYAQKMLKEAIQNNSPDDQITALKRIIRLDPKNYFTNFIKLDSISDNVQTLRNKHKSQFAMVRYDVAQKDAENKNLKLKNLEDDNKILILLGTLILLVLIIVFLRKRQKQLKQEKELEVKNTQLKMSKKVHDVVANGIYQVMAKIENQEDFDREKTLDELEFVYEKSRNLSYEKAGEEKEFSQEISELIASFNNASVKTFTAGNSSSVWTNISAPVKEEIYQVLRELMVNMKKHSKASHVAVKFEKADQNIEIQYKDNGVGIAGDLIYKNGLRNTASRIEGIGGNITFETKIEKGLKVNISFPSS